jgi:hypothetical protein
MGRLEIAWYMVRTRALHTVHQGSLNFPNKESPQIPSEECGFGGCDTGGDMMVVKMVAIETMLVVMIMIMVMVLGTLTQVPFHHDLATFLLALSIPAPPTRHKQTSLPVLSEYATAAVKEVSSLPSYSNRRMLHSRVSNSHCQ